MKYIVTELGPIDRHAPGTDVTGMYKPDVLARLIDEGFVAEAVERNVAPVVAMTGNIEAVANDGQPADEDGE